MSRQGLDVFISYDPVDAGRLEELEAHLSLLRRQGLVRTWHSGRLLPGSERAEAIEAYLAEADIVLLLVSPAFMASDDCWNVEMTRALERHTVGTARVIPVILRHCDWRDAPFGKLQPLPRNAEPVTSWPDPDEAWLEVVEGIREVYDGAHRPLFPDEHSRQLSAQLEELYERRARQEGVGIDTAELGSKILDLRRQLRRGPQLSAGDFLLDGRFKLFEILGQGGFATVWKAYDREDRQLVALKLLHGQYSGDRSRRERFFRGARRMAQLQHEGIVRVVERKCEDGGFYFFVMEHLADGDLRRAVLDELLGREEALEVVLECGRALSFAHRQGVIHRDVKPANILLDRMGHPKLTDFDLFRASDTTGGTRTGMMGSFLYASPEQMERPQTAGIAADVYSLGMTVLFILNGSDLPTEVLRDMQGFMEQRLQVGKTLQAALLRATAWTPEERWTTVEGFCGALRQALSETSVVIGDPVARPTDPAESRRGAEDALKMGKLMEAGGLFEAAQAWRKAAECYQAVGAWEQALKAWREEVEQLQKGGVQPGQDDLRAINLIRVEILQKLHRDDEAAEILEEQGDP